MTALATAFVAIEPQIAPSFPKKMRSAGEKGGEQLAEGVRRGADGRLRDANGHFVAEAGKAGKSAGKGFSSRFSKELKVGAALVGAFAVVKGVQFFKDSINEASDLNESINAVNVTFGKNAGGIKKLGKEAADSVGLSNKEFNGLAVQFSAFAGTIAGKGGNVTGTMDKLTTRGADFASVMNLEVNEAMGLFQSGLAGETEPLRKFGIDLSAAAVESHAYATGIAEAGKPLTENQKVQARYSLLMKQTSKTQGDFANTSDSLANSQRILGANVDNIQAKLGGFLIPVLEKLSGWMVGKVVPAFEKFVTGMKTGQGAGGVFATALGVVRGAAERLWGILQPIGAWLLNNKAVVATFVAVLGGFLIISKITKAVLAFNIVLAANPIGIVVVAVAAFAAALVYAYRKSDTFRAVVDKAWAKIKSAVSSAWNGVIKPALAAMARWITGTLIPTVNRLWKSVIAPAFRAIGAIIRTMWNGVVRPILSLWVGYLRNVLFPVIRFLWNNVIGPAFRGIGAIIRGVWNGVIRPTFNALKEGINLVRAGFRIAVDAIGRIWDGLKAKARAPVSFVVNTVLAGMVKAMNKIPGVNIGVPSFARGGVLPGYTPGRDVHEFFSPSGGRLNLSGGEAVMRPEFTRAVGGARGVDRLNRAAQHGSLRPLSYFLGGVLPMPAATSISRHSGYPWAQWAGDLNGEGDDTGKAVVAWKSGFVSAVRSMAGSYGRHIRVNHAGQNTLYAHLNGFNVGSGAQVRAGQRIGAVGSTGNSSGPHLHFEVAGGAVSGSATAGGGNPLAQFLGAIKAVKEFAGNIKGWIAKLGSFGAWGDLFKGALRSVLGSARDWVNDKIPGPGPFPAFDRGGVATGRGSLGKTTLRPERVLSPRQTESFDRLVTMLERGDAGGPLVHMENVYTRDERELAYKVRTVQENAMALSRLA